MSEIEKLYKLAGIKKEFERPTECRKNPYITCDGCMLYDNGKCLNKKDYPLFTPEKQLELFKWMLKNGYNVPILILNHGYTLWNGYPEFSEALSEIVKDLWRDLTEKEQKEIKSILEGYYE